MIAANHLFLRRLGIDTQQHPIVYMRRDCHICRAEGFNGLARIGIATGNKHIIASLNIVSSPILAKDEVGLSDAAWRLLNAREGQKAYFSHPSPVDSMSHIRAKLHGHSISIDGAKEIVADIQAGRYSDIQLTAYITACCGDRLNSDETLAITRAMLESGQRLSWPKGPIVDKHCIGGLPGNRTTPIVVAIVSALGLIIPKTSSRAITSAAGTADTMEVLAPVNLSLKQMKQVVDKTGGCVVWGSGVSLSPIDDIVIRIERALDLDSEGQLVASIVSKKVAAGSTHLLLDIPIGATAKVRNQDQAERLKGKITTAANSLGLRVETLFSDGSQPIGFGIGPALEAFDILAILNQDCSRPLDLEQKSVQMAASILEMAGSCRIGEGWALAQNCLQSGQAKKQFERICEAQGGMRTPPKSRLQHPVCATNAGIVSYIHTHLIAVLAKLAGAPAIKSAGLVMHVNLGDSVELDQPLYTLHTHSQGALDYALNFLLQHDCGIRIDQELL